MGMFSEIEFKLNVTNKEQSIMANPVSGGTNRTIFQSLNTLATVAATGAIVFLADEFGECYLSNAANNETPSKELQALYSISCNFIGDAIGIDNLQKVPPAVLVSAILTTLNSDKGVAAVTDAINLSLVAIGALLTADRSDVRSARSDYRDAKRDGATTQEELKAELTAARQELLTTNKKYEDAKAKLDKSMKAAVGAFLSDPSLNLGMDQNEINAAATEISNALTELVGLQFVNLYNTLKAAVVIEKERFNGMGDALANIFTKSFVAILLSNVLGYVSAESDSEKTVALNAIKAQFNNKLSSLSSADKQLITELLNAIAILITSKLGNTVSSTNDDWKNFLISISNFIQDSIPPSNNYTSVYYRRFSPTYTTKYHDLTGNATNKNQKVSQSGECWASMNPAQRQSLISNARANYSDLTQLITHSGSYANVTLNDSNGDATDAGADAYATWEVLRDAANDPLYGPQLAQALGYPDVAALKAAIGTTNRYT